MTTAQIIESLIGAGTLSGGAKLVAKLTRIAVAVEDAAAKLGKLAERQEVSEAKLADHEVRLARGGL